jgi:hypothetical protein
MQLESTATTAPPRALGRPWLWLGILTVPLTVAAVVLQSAVFKLFFMPWYALGLLTLGVLLVAIALFQRPSLTRGLVLAGTSALTAFAWYALLILTQLPNYAGPAKQGALVPAFTTTLADGSAFSDSDLRAGAPAVLVFFRGRW